MELHDGLLRQRTVNDHLDKRILTLTRDKSGSDNFDATLKLKIMQIGEAVCDTPVRQQNRVIGDRDLLDSAEKNASNQIYALESQIITSKQTSKTLQDEAGGL